MLDKIKNRLQLELFITSPLAIATNPLYILRNGLYKSVLSLAIQVSGNVLDFGCGSKPYESLFKNVSNYTGVEIEGIWFNKEECKADCFYDGKNIPFPNNHFDTVVSFEVLEHIPNINEMLGELRRVLKPGGKILVTVPFAWDEHEVPYDYTRYTSYGIKKVLETNNFEILETKKSTTYFLAACQMIIAYFHKHLSPKNKFLAAIFQLLVIFPLNLISLLLNFILPKKYGYFCNTIILGKKSEL